MVVRVFPVLARPVGRSGAPDVVLGPAGVSHAEEAVTDLAVHRDLDFRSRNGEFLDLGVLESLRLDHPQVLEQGPDGNDISNQVANLDVFVANTAPLPLVAAAVGFERILLEEYDYRDQVRLADMDQDGDHDIVSLLSVGQSAVVMYENIDGYTYIRRDSKIFSPGVGIFVVADINNETFPDVICEKEPSVYALTNTGDFTLSDPEFTEMTNHGCVFRDLCCSDLDGNGFPDIIVIEYWHYHLPTNLSIKYNDGTGHFLPEPQTAVNDDGDMPYACSLMNYPNPFNDLTRIKFSLRMPCQSVFLQIYNLKGTLIRTLIREGSFDAGLHEIVWDARDNRGIGMGSGVYLSRLAIEDKIITRKMLLVE